MTEWLKRTLLSAFTKRWSLPLGEVHLWKGSHLSEGDRPTRSGSASTVKPTAPSLVNGVAACMGMPLISLRQQYRYVNESKILGNGAPNSQTRAAVPQLQEPSHC